MKSKSKKPQNKATNTETNSLTRRQNHMYCAMSFIKKTHHLHGNPRLAMNVFQNEQPPEYATRSAQNKESEHSTKTSKKIFVFLPDKPMPTATSEVRHPWVHINEIYSRPATLPPFTLDLWPNEALHNESVASAATCRPTHVYSGQETTRR